MTYLDVEKDLKEKENIQKAPLYARFFQSGPGQYAEGDRFLGITVPDQRKIAKKYANLPVAEVVKLLTSPIHEHRLTALFILVGHYKKGDRNTRSAITRAYLAHSAYVNNWDLVDSSAGYLVGMELPYLPKDILSTLAKSESLWERRIAMIATFHCLKQGDPGPTIKIANILQKDEHHLIQKAVGWMIREMGKCCDRKLLTDWLEENDRYKTLPRTLLRYAIEHLPEKQRKYYLQK